MTSGEELMRDLLEARHQEDRSAIANDLLKAFFRGYPVDNLRVLLRSTDPEMVKSGIWIASELGARGRSLLNDVLPLLAHAVAWVRFFAIDCIVTYTTERDGVALAQAIALLLDQDEAVRRKATRALMQFSDEQLLAALAYMESSWPWASELVSGLRVLVQKERLEPSAMLKSESAVLRKLGLASIVRNGQHSESLLQMAASSEDEDVQELAKEQLEIGSAGRRGC